MFFFWFNIFIYVDFRNVKYDLDQDLDFGKEQESKIDFIKIGGFIGEDERFVYKRVMSRFWELCSGQWYVWEGDWWCFLVREVRYWEGKEVLKFMFLFFINLFKSEIIMGEFVELDEIVGLERYRV